MCQTDRVANEITKEGLNMALTFEDMKNRVAAIKALLGELQGAALAHIDEDGGVHTKPCSLILENISEAADVMDSISSTLDEL